MNHHNRILSIHIEKTEKTDNEKPDNEKTDNQEINGNKNENAIQEDQICFICYEDLSDNRFPRECNCSFEVCQKCATILIRNNQYGIYVCPQCNHQGREQIGQEADTICHRFQNYFNQNCDNLVYFIILTAFLIVIKDAIEYYRRGF